MRLVVQRVLSASVEVAGTLVGQTAGGLLVLAGISARDTHADAVRLAKKTAFLRIFDDEAGRMNRSVLDIGGGVLAVSQFTLYGDCRRGNRPSYIEAAAPEAARELFDFFVEQLRSYGLPVETGVFQAEMKVRLVNDGPVTLILDSQSGPGA